MGSQVSRHAGAHGIHGRASYPGSPYLRQCIRMLRARIVNDVVCFASPRVGKFMHPPPSSPSIGNATDSEPFVPPTSKFSPSNDKPVNSPNCHDQDPSSNNSFHTPCTTPAAQRPLANRCIRGSPQPGMTTTRSSVAPDAMLGQQRHKLRHLILRRSHRATNGDKPRGNVVAAASSGPTRGARIRPIG